MSVPAQFDLKQPQFRQDDVIADCAIGDVIVGVLIT